MRVILGLGVSYRVAIVVIVVVIPPLPTTHPHKSHNTNTHTQTRTLPGRVAQGRLPPPRRGVHAQDPLPAVSRPQHGKNVGLCDRLVGNSSSCSSLPWRGENVGVGLLLCVVGSSGRWLGLGGLGLVAGGVGVVGGEGEAGQAGGE